MSDDEPLAIAYERHDRVALLLDTIRYVLEERSLSAEGWDDPQCRGPGMYLVVVSGRSVAEHADPLGDNRWPVEESRDVLADPGAFAAAAERVAYECDGTGVVSVDGVVQERMVRFRDPPSPGGEYADWMGTRHMSALDTSRRDTVIAALTLSQESGRVTVFRDGTYDSVEREAIAARWRAD
ncbi:diadenylate cyclase [Halovivax sp.]|uniref:diadenylate cyclase n=1 Tax=Halovivax sp. TaxID=1935978 RepID=UPI0025BD3E3C|nr:diadenylate cyclase [Halovivax sp.]